MVSETAEKETWTTGEELLLACAVKRHGLEDWDSVAMELQNRSSNAVVLTAEICRNKYHDLKRRFMDTGRTGEEVDSIPWLEELRKLRVAELEQEVHRYDLSIQSLELKVKRLEEERERSLEENENDDEKPDLEKDLEEERSENDKRDGNRSPTEASPENAAGKPVSGEYSDRDSRTLNESNSTQNGEKADGREHELEPVETGTVKPDPDIKRVGEDSCNDSSDTVAKHAASKPSEEKKFGDDRTELRDSAAELKEGAKESSDVQSSASLRKKKRRRGEVSGGSDEPVVSPATIKRDSVKSEPLVGFLDIIRSHKHGSMFLRRLKSQDTEQYKNTVRQHVDLETVQTRIEDGSYSSRSTKFYLDLLLLFTNAIVFFPTASPESVAAYELRNLVSKELKKQRIGRQPEPSPEPAPLTLLQPKPDPERSDSLLAIAKHKSSVPIVVCRKRSSISSKPSSSGKAEKQADDKPVFKSSSKPDKQADDKPVFNPKQPVKSSSTTPPGEEESSIKLKAKERPVTGVRSMRRSSNRSTNSTTQNKIHITNSSLNPGSTNKGDQAPKVEKKKTEVTAAVKKRGAADFLKRIKKNSPAKEASLETLKSSAGDDNSGGRTRDQKKKKVDEGKEGTSRLRSSGGGGGGKQKNEESSLSKRAVGRPPKKGREAVPAKRGREGGEVAVAALQKPNKRSRSSR